MQTKAIRLHGLGTLVDSLNLRKLIMKGKNTGSAKAMGAKDVVKDKAKTPTLANVKKDKVSPKDTKTNADSKKKK